VIHRDFDGYGNREVAPDQTEQVEVLRDSSRVSATGVATPTVLDLLDAQRSRSPQRGSPRPLSMRGRPQTCGSASSHSGGVILLAREALAGRSSAKLAAGFLAWLAITTAVSGPPLVSVFGGMNRHTSLVGFGSGFDCRVGQCVRVSRMRALWTARVVASVFLGRASVELFRAHRPTSDRSIQAAFATVSRCGAHRCMPLPNSPLRAPASECTALPRRCTTPRLGGTDFRPTASLATQLSAATDNVGPS
jgi:hypothetical protein